MAEDIEQSLVHRLQALRASSAKPEPIPPASFVSAGAMVRAKTPTREEALVDRLKHLRLRDAAIHSSLLAPPSPSIVQSPAASGRSFFPNAASRTFSGISTAALKELDDDEADALFQTDDHTLEELLRDVDGRTPQHQLEPHEDEVRALLDKLSLHNPCDDEAHYQEAQKFAEQADSSDNSEGEQMARRADDIITRFQREFSLEAVTWAHQQSPGAADADGHINPRVKDDDSVLAFDLPSLPPNLAVLPSATSLSSGAACDADIDARIAALRAPLALPTVPTTQPSGTAAARLSSRTNYTDDDVDSWCTVCLDDATLRCLGCDDDPYCTRCWAEMHVGPAAAFNDCTHKSVQFLRRRPIDKTKVATGAT